MQKALTFLEQHVQWLTLGLASVFLLYCAYAYVITPPAVVTIGSQKDVTPREIDEKIKEGPVADIDRARKAVGELAIVVPDVVKPWQTQMSAPGGPILVGNPINAPISKIGPSTFVNPNAAGVAVVDALPRLPKAMPLAATSGLSVVTPPAVRGAAGAPAQAANAQNMDQLWATASFTVPAKDLQDAFDKVLAGKNLGGLQLTTNILWVELQRQRGTAGANGPVFPAGDQNIELVPVPNLLQGEFKALPDAAASIPEKSSFSDWAEKNVDLICRPKFFDVHAGTPWVAPVAAAAAGAPAAAVPAPAALGAPLAVPPAQGIPAPGGNNGRGAGQIIPNAITQDILVWANDGSVQPGAVYRYRVVYHMKNPVLGLSVVGAPKIVDVLDVKSPASDWSAPVAIPETTKFWFANLRGNGAAVDVFHWENGAWKKEPAVLAPGDKIAGSDWTVVDVHGNISGARDREKYVLLANDSGEVQRRYPRTDSSNEEYKGLLTDSNPAAAAGTSVPNRNTGQPAASPPGSTGPGRRPMPGGR